MSASMSAYGRGDPLSVSGRLQVRRWTDSDGAGREQWQVIADAIVSARAVRPGGGSRAAGARAHADDDAPFDDLDVFDQ